MKRAFWVCLFVALALPARADLWTDDYAKAAAKAKSEGKALLLDFTGSDWCGWCKKLDAEVFSKKEFKEYAQQNLVCVTVDFPHSFNLSSKQARQNEELAAKYGVHGYPTIVLLDPEERPIGVTGYQPGGAKSYVQHLQGILAQYAPPPKPAQEKGQMTAPAAPAREVRTWTSMNGSTLEATFDRMMGDRVWLKKADGVVLQIAFDGLSDGDREYLRSIHAY